MFQESIQSNQLVMLEDENENPITAFTAYNNYSVVVYSSPELSSERYIAYKVSSVTGDLKETVYSNISNCEDKEILSISDRNVMGRPGMGMDGERPELPDGEEPKFGDGEEPKFGDGERPEPPEGEAPEPAGE